MIYIYIYNLYFVFFHDIYAVYWHFGGGLNNTQGGLVFVSVCPLHMFALCEGKGAAEQARHRFFSLIPERSISMSAALT